MVSLSVVSRWLSFVKLAGGLAIAVIVFLVLLGWKASRADADLVHQDEFRPFKERVDRRLDEMNGKLDLLINFEQQRTHR